MLNTQPLMFAIPFAVVSATASAGGMEKTAMPTAFIYESGNYAELSFQNSDYDVSSSAGGNVSVVGDLQMTSFAFKVALTDSFSFGVARYLQSSIDINYPSNWVTSQASLLGGSSLATDLPSANLKIDATAALMNYHVNENFSVTGGVKISTVQDASLKIPFAATNIAVTGDTETSYVYGLAYERPDIALRAELVREESVEFSLAANGTFGAIPGTPPTVLQATGAQASLPNYTTLNLQSGIAPDTLAFFSARRADWEAHQVILSNALGSSAISSFTDTTTYSVGIGRKITESLSGSISYNWEEGSSPTSTSSLSITDGYRGISAGLKYNTGNITISGGINYTELGDTIVSQAGTNLSNAPFEDNSVTTVGLRIGYHF